MLNYESELTSLSSELGTLGCSSCRFDTYCSHVRNLRHQDEEARAQSRKSRVNEFDDNQDINWTREVVVQYEASCS